MTSNAIRSISFRLAGLSAGKYSLFCIQQIYFMMSDGPCWEQSMGAERGASGERSVRNIVGARSGFLSKGRSDRSVSLRYRSHHEPRACTNPSRIHLCLQQLTKLSAYTSKIVRCEGEMELVKYFQKQTDVALIIYVQHMDVSLAF